MPLGTEAGLGPGDIVLDGDHLAPKQKAPPPKWGPTLPDFGPCLLWPNGLMDQDKICIEVGLGQGHIVLDGDPASDTPVLKII